MRWLRRLAWVAIVLTGWWWLRQHDGQMMLEWQGYRLAPSLSTLAPVLLLLWWLITRFDRGCRWLRGMARRSGQWMSLHHQQAALEQVVDAFTALATGDLPEADRLTRRLDRKLQGRRGAIQPLYHLLAAQVSQQAGRKQEAEGHYQALQQTPSGKFLGMRGSLALKRQAVLAGSPSAAEQEEWLALAEEAYRLKPKAPWAVLALVEAHLLRGQWTEAQRILHRSRGRGVGRQDYLRLMALVEYQQAKAAESRRDKTAWLRHAAKAVQYRPQFTAAVLLLADYWQGERDEGKLRKILKQAWSSQPHPTLAERYLALVPKEDRVKRYKAGQQLTKGQLDQPASQLLLAELAFEAGELPAARHYAEAAWKAAPGWSSWQWMQRLGVPTGDHAAVQISDDPAWRCQRCAAAHSQWQMHCQQCGTLDSVEWAMPQGLSLRQEQALLSV